MHPQYNQPGCLVINSLSAKTGALQLASLPGSTVGLHGTVGSGTVLKVIRNTGQRSWLPGINSGLNTLSKFI